MTPKEISEKYLIKNYNVYYRASRLKIDITKDISEVDVERILRYRYKRTIMKDHKKPIKVMEYFFSMQDNSSVAIATALKLRPFQVDRIISDYFLNQGLIIESKLNFK